MLYKVTQHLFKRDISLRYCEIEKPNKNVYFLGVIKRIKSSVKAHAECNSFNT